MGLFSKIREGLKKTKDSMMQKVERVINSFTKSTTTSSKSWKRR